MRNIFLIGPMGVGKTTIGRHLARELKLSFYDSDHEIEKRTGADIAWIFDIEGEAGFRRREQEIIDEITQYKNIVLATGGGVVVTHENRNALCERGIVVYLNFSIEQQFKRTQHDKKRPLLQTDNLLKRLKELDQQRTPLYEKIADLTVVTDGRSVNGIVQEIVQYIRDN